MHSLKESRESQHFSSILYLINQLTLVSLFNGY